MISSLPTGQIFLLLDYQGRIWRGVATLPWDTSYLLYFNVNPDAVLDNYWLSLALSLDIIFYTQSHLG